MITVKKLLAVVLTALSMGLATSAVASDYHHESRYGVHPYAMQVDHRHHGDRRYYRDHHRRYSHKHGWHRKHHYSDRHHRYNRHDRWDRRYDARHRYDRSRYVW